MGYNSWVHVLVLSEALELMQRIAMQHNSWAPAVLTVDYCGLLTFETVDHDAQ